MSRTSGRTFRILDFFILSLVLFISIVDPSSASSHGFTHGQHHTHLHVARQGENGATALRAAETPSHAMRPEDLTSRDAEIMIEKALRALAIINKDRIENPQRNAYQFQNASSILESQKEAPPLNYIEILTGNSSTRNGIRQRSDKNTTIASTNGFVYTIPRELAEAARIVAESVPPTPSTGNHSLVAARIHQKYRLKVNDTNMPQQSHLRPNGLMNYVPAGLDPQAVVMSNTTQSQTLTKRADPSFWMLDMAQHGVSPYAPSGYKVWRNVKDYGAMGDGLTDDTAAINAAISDGDRCGNSCGSSTIYPAVIYFPPGTYVVSSPIIQYYNTQFYGNPLEYPTILAASSFVGLGVITSDVYTGTTSEWYVNTNNFLRSIKNFKIDITRTDPNAYICAIHWQVAQATSLENIDFYMMQDPSTTQQGIYMENGSGGFLANLTFVGGNFGAYFGNQQFTTSHLAFVNCNTALQIHWDWAWTMQDLIIESCTKGLVIVGGAGGPMSTGQSVGSLVLVDSIIANTPTGIITSLYNENSTSFLVQNTGFFNVEAAVIDDVEQVILMPGGDQVMVDSWGFGLLATSSTNSTFIDAQDIPVMDRTDSLVGETGYYKPNFFTRRRPAYTDIGMSQVIDVKAWGATGDGQTDDTAVLNSILDRAANMSSIVFFPFGIYVVTDTLYVPVGSRIIGQAWSQIMATGPNFEDEMNPRVAVQVGRHGDSGIIEIQDMMFTVSGATAGAVLMEWNVHESTQGSAGMWDSHFRVGGAVGSNLQASNCPKNSGANPNCKAASLLLHFTAQSSAYLENVWAWVADHDMDLESQDQIDVYSARGILVESQGPTWLYGTASEHSIMYQYQLSQAESIVMGMIQTESPYFQPSPKAPGPFTVGLFSNDPTFEECDANSASCAMAWALRIIDSATVYSLGSGLYSWFSDYAQDCLNTDNCQSRIMQIEQSSDTWLYNIVTKGTVEMVTPVNENATLAAANQNGYMSSILAWVRAHNATIGQRIFRGFQLYDPSDLEDLTAPCVTALTQIIKCDSYLLKFQEAFYHGSLGNDTLTDSVCDKSCGASLQEWFDTVSMSCAGQNVTGAVPTKLGGIVYQGYNETCLKDPGSGEYCNDIISGFTLVADINQMPKDEMCSYCYMTKLQMMQLSPYSAYNTDLQRDLQVVHSTCAISGSTDLPPSLIIREPDAPTMCVSGNTYTTKDGDTCDSIASNYGVASAALFMANSDIIVNCSSPATNATLCLPLTCGSLYTLQSTDNCTTIESAQGLGYGQLRAYNPWIYADCSNLQVASQFYGRMLCLDPQAGTFTATAPIPGLTLAPTQSNGYTRQAIPPGANSTVAADTTTNCGKWHVAQNDETCAMICTQEGIPANLFFAVNPSLSSSSCDSSLVNGTTYCVGPVYGWNITIPVDPSNSASNTPTPTP